MTTPFSLLCYYFIIGVVLCYLFIEIGGPERLAAMHPDFDPQLVLTFALLMCFFAWPLIAFMTLIIAAFGSGEGE